MGANRIVPSILEIQLTCVVSQTVFFFFFTIIKYIALLRRTCRQGIVKRPEKNRRVLMKRQVWCHCIFDIHVYLMVQKYNIYWHDLDNASLPSHKMKNPLPTVYLPPERFLPGNSVKVLCQVYTCISPEYPFLACLHVSGALSIKRLQEHLFFLFGYY